MTADQKCWRRLVKNEPRLKDLERDALALHRGDEDVEWGDWEGVKQRLSRLVGWWAESPRIRSHKDFEVAYDHLLTCWECGRRPWEPAKTGIAPWEVREGQMTLIPAAALVG